MAVITLMDRAAGLYRALSAAPERAELLELYRTELLELADELGDELLGVPDEASGDPEGCRQEQELLSILGPWGDSQAAIELEGLVRYAIAWGKLGFARSQMVTIADALHGWAAAIGGEDLDTCPACGRSTPAGAPACLRCSGRLEEMGTRGAGESREQWGERLRREEWSA